MSLKLYMDEHVPYAITYNLRSRGVDVLTAQEDGGEEMPDEWLLERADTLGREVFTQDEDFLAIAANRQSMNVEFCCIFYAHHNPARNAIYAKSLLEYATFGERQEKRSQVVYLH